MFDQQRRRKARTAAVLILTLTIGLLTGCGVNKNTNTATEDGVKTQSYGDDGYLGMTNSHTKIPGRHMALNYKNDANMMAQSIRNLPGVAGTNVTFSGSDAYVTVKLAPSLADRDVPALERQAASVLRFNFPRYNIHVKSLRQGK
ncbi:hypothetical protein ACFPVX_08350 [Cohnella faecalis]|uniref:Sporulation protein n=1 Tax=Cohnella faecalis TaxID=2315694 RepID=A0A398CPZ8_9BACL|nr:hypothetical protein [Cohnella faecalis]RIE01044.1 hypothetical protein D3H35_21635 [Cohnella faecalis]